jgi:hypothetical protein
MLIAKLLCHQPQHKTITAIIAYHAARNHPREPTHYLGSTQTSHSIL